MSSTCFISKCAVNRLSTCKKPSCSSPPISFAGLATGCKIRSNRSKMRLHVGKLGIKRQVPVAGHRRFSKRVVKVQRAEHLCRPTAPSCGRSFLAAPPSKLKFSVSFQWVIRRRRTTAHEIVFALPLISGEYLSGTVQQKELTHHMKKLYTIFRHL